MTLLLYASAAQLISGEFGSAALSSNSWHKLIKGAAKASGEIRTKAVETILPSGEGEGVRQERDRKEEEKLEE